MWIIFLEKPCSLVGFELGQYFDDYFMVDDWDKLPSLRGGQKVPVFCFSRSFELEE